MDYKIYQLFKESSFNFNSDLVGLQHMIKAYSLKLSSLARERLAWMDCYRECQNVNLVCRKYGIVRKTFYRWRQRYNPWELTSLESLSRRPKHSPRQTPWEIEVKILELKKLHPRWGKEKIAFYLKTKQIIVSGKTVWKILSRYRLNLRYKTRKRKSVKPRINWAEIHSPGDLAELDTKFISLYGKRVYQYTLIDVTTRWRYAEIHSQLTNGSTIKFLETAFIKAPLKFKTIQTDNGHEFQKTVTLWLSQKKIRHVFTHKARPIENSFVERSHRIDEEEFYSLGNYGATLTELQTNFAKYLEMYNTERPHWSLKGLTPQQTLNNYLNKVCQMS